MECNGRQYSVSVLQLIINGTEEVAEATCRLIVWNSQNHTAGIEVLSFPVVEISSAQVQTLAIYTVLQALYRILGCSLQCTMYSFDCTMCCIDSLC